MSSFLCVVLAVYRPDPTYLSAQLASLAAQSRKPDLLVAVVADLASHDLVTQACADLGLPMHLATPGSTLDSVKAFEFGLQTALALTPAGTIFALCDQDDIWHPDRLRIGAEALAIGTTQMVHSDARLVDATGQVIHASLFGYERRLRNPGLRGLLYRNTVTGMTMLMRRSLVERALPFPRQSGVFFYHDLWLALVAQASGGIVLIDQPLVDYRQHGGNAIGAVDRTGKPTVRRRPPDMAWLRREAGAYALARYLAHCLHYRLTTTGLDEADPALKPLRRYRMRLRGAGGHALDAARYLLTGQFGLASLAMSSATVSSGRLAWCLKTALTGGLNEASRDFEDRLFSLAPGVQPPSRDDLLPGARKASAVTELVDPRKTARWTPVMTAEAPAITLLVPTLNPTEIFAGVATAVDLGLALAAAGHSVRFVATDLPMASPIVSRQFLTGRLSGAQADTGAAARITLHCGVTEPTIPAHPGDRFIATAWWTAIVARKLIAAHGFTWPRFVYLIQDYEPGFYPWGSEYADALSSYSLDFIPLFNTTLLRDHFAAAGFAFAGPKAIAFRPAINVDRYASLPRAAPDAKGRRRIMVYGRPEVARNLFPTAVEALDLFLSRAGLTPDQVILDSVGLRHPPVHLSGGHVLTSRGKLPYEEYPAYLSSVDLGLSLMLSPHPSHPPLEMAAAGARVVTNGYGVKDLSLLSPSLLSTPPDPEALAGAMARAWALPSALDAERRIDLTTLGLTLEEAAQSLAPSLLPRPDPAAPRRVILHVGAPKCGSTFLQRVLLSNRQRLVTLGIAYPHDGDGHPGNGGQLASITRDSLLADFGTCNTLIYSHEDLLSHVINGTALAALAKELGIQVQVVAFLRPLSQLMFGTYSQMMKQRFEEFAAAGAAYEGLNFEQLVHRIAHRYDVDTYLSGWEKLFPGTRAVHSDAIRDEIETLLNTGDLDWTVPRALTNPSLRVQDCDHIAALIREGKTPIEDLRAAFTAAHHHIGQPDEGRTAARIALVDTVFTEQIAALAKNHKIDLGPALAAPTAP